MSSPPPQSISTYCINHQKKSPLSSGRRFWRGFNLPKWLQKRNCNDNCGHHERLVLKKHCGECSPSRTPEDTRKEPTATGTINLFASCKFGISLQRSGTDNNLLPLARLNFNENRHLACDSNGRRVGRGIYYRAASGNFRRLLE